MRGLGQEILIFRYQKVELPQLVKNEDLVVTLAMGMSSCSLLMSFMSYSSSNVELFGVLPCPLHMT